MADKPEFITSAELVDRWQGKICQGTLANWRSKRRGPPYHKIGGRVLYRLDEIERWEQQNRK